MIEKRTHNLFFNTAETLDFSDVLKQVQEHISRTMLNFYTVIQVTQKTI
ncbi:MAG: hypothetical protein R3Y09_13490 [Clostridia bacterium]